MIAYGYAMQIEYQGDGTLLVQVRIPSIHGPFDITQAKGIQMKTYTQDKDLPWIQSVLLPHMPVKGEVVMLSSVDNTPNEWVVIGLTGGSYYGGVTNA